ncbi:MAG: FKBP-type peptidyl-prolyl cis-trans isomerase [Bacteroidetes bacterium]|nr:FKBP-type peptidyl-prolyl cis-trans isomerase [Bacteroidota bacterium]HET6244937.1 FKBP-type peptidyl-prolyl cis-trans isomerase [Bacteroidia bacterium]
MIYRFHTIVLVFMLAVTLSDCSENQSNNKNRPTEAEYKEKLIAANKNMVKKDDEQIKNYIKLHKIPMQESGTGLRYFISGKGIGEKAKTGQYATLNFKLTLLDGTLCYSSDENGPEEFLIGQANVESGLHEGITYMRVGEKGVFILPPHLAHGLLGDENKIPQRATLVYNVELLSLR